MNSSDGFHMQLVTFIKHWLAFIIVYIILIALTLTL